MTRRLAFGPVVLLVVGIVTVGAGAPHAHAQRYDGFRLDRFKAAPTQEDGFALQLPDTLGHLRWSVGLTLNYTHAPLVVESQIETANRGYVIKNRLQTQLVTALGLSDMAEVHARIPVVVTQGGDRVVYISEPGPEAFAMDDISVGGSVRLLGERTKGLQLGLVADLLLPTGSQENFGGDYGFGPRVMLTGAYLVPESVTVAAQAGATYRPERDYDRTSLGTEAVGALGVYVTAVPRLVLAAELTGALGLRDTATGDPAQAFEAQLGVRYTSKPGFAVQAAIGGGLHRDLGVPATRAMLGLGFAPPRSKPAPPPPPPQHFEPPAPADSDKDGVVDAGDHCPYEPEDKDGFQDEDGCPDVDNDGDGVNDGVDQCPLRPEDVDSYSDTDGCPDPDNDEDGIPDERDSCPLEPEDKDGFMDQDGCAETDNDGDGVADEQDKCPLTPGAAEAQGCPKSVRLESKQIKILSRIEFRSGRAKLKRSGERILEEVRAVLQAHPWIKRIRIDGHTDDRGSLKFNLKLSQRRAEAVMAWLAAQGVSEERLEAKGFGEEHPRTSNKTRKGRQENRRVEFHIVDPPDGLGSVAVPVQPTAAVTGAAAPTTVTTNTSVTTKTAEPAAGTPPAPGSATPMPPAPITPTPPPAPQNPTKVNPF